MTACAEAFRNAIWSVAQAVGMKRREILQKHEHAKTYNRKATQPFSRMSLEKATDDGATRLAKLENVLVRCATK